VVDPYPALVAREDLQESPGSHGRLLIKLAKTDVLIIDDWGFAPPRDQERKELLESPRTATGTGRRS
jgi:hypothetical protein